MLQLPADHVLRHTVKLSFALEEVHSVFRRRLADLRLPSLGLRLNQIDHTLVGVPENTPEIDTDDSSGQPFTWVLLAANESPHAAREDALEVVIANVSRDQAEGALEAIQCETQSALMESTRQVLLELLHETRQLDTRLMPGGEFGLEVLHIARVELHERLHADSQRALRTVRSALQPFAIAGQPNVFVYRQMRDRSIFLLDIVVSTATRTCCLFAPA